MTIQIWLSLELTTLSSRYPPSLLATPSDLSGMMFKESSNLKERNWEASASCCNTVGNPRRVLGREMLTRFSQENAQATTTSGTSVVPILALLLAFPPSLWAMIQIWSFSINRVLSVDSQIWKNRFNG